MYQLATVRNTYILQENAILERERKSSVADPEERKQRLSPSRQTALNSTCHLLFGSFIVTFLSSSALNDAALAVLLMPSRQLSAAAD